MRRVVREDLWTLERYERERVAVRARSIAEKERRRLEVGDLTFLFENRETISYQIQEIMRAEQIAKEASIRLELDTYNAMLGGPGQLGCALLIEIEDEAERRPLLEAWLGLQECLYAELACGGRIRAEYDSSQVGRGRISAVQYLKFTLPEAPVRLGSDFPVLELSVGLDSEMRTALSADLAATLI